MSYTNLTTLCYIETEDSYLMLHRVKKEGDMNRDKWLGVGGHFEEGESPEECLLREVREETGLILKKWRFRGVVTFVSDRWPDEYMCLYTADCFEGTVGECREGHLEWVKKDRIRELNLWEGDLIFFDLLRENRPFFSLKLRYEGQSLREAVLDGDPLELDDWRNRLLMGILSLRTVRGRMTAKRKKTGLRPLDRVSGSRGKKKDGRRSWLRSIRWETVSLSCRIRRRASYAARSMIKESFRYS